MQAEAFARVRKLLRDQRGAITTAGILGVLHSLLVLKLFCIAGVIAGLLATQGVARFPMTKMAELPSWVEGRVTGSDERDILFDDTGIFSIAANSWDSADPIHRFVARQVLPLINAAPFLRNNLGALATLVASGLVVLLALSLIAEWRRGILADSIGLVATGLRRQIHRQTYRLGQSSLATEGTGPAVNLLTREVNDIRDALFAELDGWLRLPVLAVGLFALAVGLSWQLTIFLSTLGILVWLTSGYLLREARNTSDSATRNAAIHLALLHEDLGLLRTVRVYGMEAIDRVRFDEHLDRFREADSLRMKTRVRLNPTSWLLYGAAIGMACALLGYNVAVARRIGPGGALLLTAALGGLAYPWLRYLQMRKAVRQGNRSAAGVFEYLDQKPELHQQGGAHFLSPLRDKISIENVTLESRSGRTLLDGLTVDIPAGSRTAIMCLEEDSKHALACLIPRLIDPKSGRVRVDGNDLREVTLESVRAQVAIVLQADLIFTDSVAMNIGLGDASYTMPRIIEAAKVAHAHNFIQDLPHGYDTVIGPLGHYLQPDQQYRIALARAYLHDPSIVIIEEPTTPLDDDTKHLLDDTVARLSRGRTLIILPHRLSTIRSCKQILLLRDGRLDAIGTPKELQADNKLYRHLQYLEFNQFATGEIEAGQMNA